MSPVRRLRAAVAVTAMTVLATTARADAPLDQYGLFDMDAETIVDAWTGLVWQRNAPAQHVDFYAAAAYCESLSLATPAGQTSGWRVPSYKELLTLVDETPHTEYVNDGLIQVWIDANAFPQTLVDREYWTSSLYVLSAAAGYAVDFSDGQGDDPKAN